MHRYEGLSASFDGLGAEFIEAFVLASDDVCLQERATSLWLEPHGGGLDRETMVEFNRLSMSVSFHPNQSNQVHQRTGLGGVDAYLVVFTRTFLFNERQGNEVGAVMRMYWRICRRMEGDEVRQRSKGDIVAIVASKKEGTLVGSKSSTLDTSTDLPWWVTM